MSLFPYALLYVLMQDHETTYPHDCTYSVKHPASALSVQMAKATSTRHLLYLPPRSALSKSMLGCLHSIMICYA